MAKRGRKKARAPAKRRERREQSERIEATPEALMKKVALVGPGNDPAYAESPTGVMVARKIITATDEHHLKDVARLWRFRNGNPSPSTIRDSGGMNDHDSEFKTNRYISAHQSLGQSWWPIIEVAVYQHYPRWLMARIGMVTPARDDAVRERDFTSGLLALSNLWGMRIPTT